MQQYGYALEKLWEATHCLVGDGTINERLGGAYTLLLRLKSELDFLPATVRYARFVECRRSSASLSNAAERRVIRI
jgi:hypothetical protein